MLPCVAGGALVGHLGDEAVGGTVRAEGREGADEMDRLGIESRGGELQTEEEGTRRERNGQGGRQGAGDAWRGRAMVLACSDGARLQFAPSVFGCVPYVCVVCVPGGVVEAVCVCVYLAAKFCRVGMCELPTCV